MHACDAQKDATDIVPIIWPDEAPRNGETAHSTWEQYCSQHSPSHQCQHNTTADTPNCNASKDVHDIAKHTVIVDAEAKVKDAQDIVMHAVIIDAVDIVVVVSVVCVVVVSSGEGGMSGGRDQVNPPRCAAPTRESDS